MVRIQDFENGTKPDFELHIPLHISAEPTVPVEVHVYTRNFKTSNCTLLKMSLNFQLLHFRDFFEILNCTLGDFRFILKQL